MTGFEVLVTVPVEGGGVEGGGGGCETGLQKGVGYFRYKILVCWCGGL